MKRHCTWCLSEGKKPKCPICGKVKSGKRKTDKEIITTQAAKERLEFLKWVGRGLETFNMPTTGDNNLDQLAKDAYENPIQPD